MSKIKDLFPGLKTYLRPIYKTMKIVAKGKPSGVETQFVSGFNVAYRKGTADENVIAESFDHDEFFSGVPEYRPAADHIILDIGAHIGAFSLLAASKVPTGKVYAIEACKDTFDVLSKNVWLNNFRNISAHHLALADKKGSTKLFYDSGNWGHSIVSPLSSCGETVMTDTLTNFVNDNKITKCHFMKLNCEGAEFPILLGTPRDVLKRFEVVLVLYHCDLWKNTTEKDLIDHFEAGGFKTSVRNKAQSVNRGWIVATNKNFK
jgi:FkbM family methyltransferase